MKYPAPVGIGEIPEDFSLSFGSKHNNAHRNVAAMDYSGSVLRIVQELKVPRFDVQYWQGARIMKAVIESCIDGSERIQLINKATRFALKSHIGLPAFDELADLRGDLERTGLLGCRVTEGGTILKWATSAPQLSKASARRLYAKDKSAKLFMPVCNTGFRPGLHTFLHEPRNKDSVIYPILYSRYQYGQDVPKLFEEEKKYIQKIADGRTVIIYDEFADTGRTIEAIMEYLWPLLPGHRILGLVNRDGRRDFQKKEQGVWWERTFDKSWQRKVLKPINWARLYAAQRLFIQ